MERHTAHRTLLDLHRLVDPALSPLFDPVGLSISTTSIVSIPREQVHALQRAGIAQTALVTLEGITAQSPMAVVIEPALSDALLQRIWQTGRVAGDQLTAVEASILQQLLNDIVGQWRISWRTAGLACVPTLTMAATLGMASDQLTDDEWFVARSIVSTSDAELGVVLFCYPASATPQLTAARASIMWRHRIERGLDASERKLMHKRLTELTAVRIPVPVTFNTELPISALNTLERGDVIALDAQPGAPMNLTMLDRPVNGRMGRTDGHLAIAIDSNIGDSDEAPVNDISDLGSNDLLSDYDVDATGATAQPPAGELA